LAKYQTFCNIQDAFFNKKPLKREGGDYSTILKQQSNIEDSKTTKLENMENLVCTPHVGGTLNVFIQRKN
jgi:phosphoglycerate dehydrogenase-like enzyme